MTTSTERDGPRRDATWALPLLALLTVLAALQRFPARTHEGLWFDEVFTVVLAVQDHPALIDRALADQTNPPGFYLLAWVWTRLGGFDLEWLRTLPALAGTLVVPAVAMLARQLGVHWRGALLAAVIANASPLLLAMSLELRAYAPLALLAAVSSALALRQAARPRESLRTAAPLALTQLALVSLHYFGALVVVGQCAALWWTDRRRLFRAVLTALPAALIAVAWVALVLSRAGDAVVGGNATWIEPADFARLRGFAPSVLGTLGLPAGSILSTTLLAAAIVLAAWQALTAASVGAPADESPSTAAGTDAHARARWLLALGVLPLGLVFVASSLGPRSLWVPRYLIVVLPALCILLAALTDMPARLARAAATTALAAWALLGGTHDAAARALKPDWTRIVRSLAGEAPATVCTNESYVALPLRYHAVREAVPLTVLDFRDCAAQRRGDRAILRAETVASLQGLIQAGAVVGAGRSLTEARPAVDIRRLRWPPRPDARD
ncbi:MAG: glycosyltransferase family 39 protein [Gemmatimonadaceae bacterium]|nr:glycosyltransferase family 39 protein [Gemmatimonadaceae bacterium]